MCMLLKFNYAKFGVSDLFLSKVIEKNIWGVDSTPPPWYRNGKDLNPIQYGGGLSGPLPLKVFIMLCQNGLQQENQSFKLLSI